MAENANFGLFEEEKGIWLPQHRVLDEAGFSKEQFQYQRHQAKRQTFRSSAAAAAEPLHFLEWESTAMPQRRRYISSSNNNNNNNRGGYGGHGMRAVFLDSGKRSCGGTGVFLPRRAGPSNSQSSNKPAFPPVLLPSRVVQALNLDVHEIGLQIKSHRDSSKQYKNGGCNRNNKKKSDHTSAQHCSPEIFLPKEWTY